MNTDKNCDIIGHVYNGVMLDGVKYKKEWEG